MRTIHFVCYKFQQVLHNMASVFLGAEQRESPRISLLFLWELDNKKHCFHANGVKILIVGIKETKNPRRNYFRIIFRGRREIVGISPLG